MLTRKYFFTQYIINYDIQGILLTCAGPAGQCRIMHKSGAHQRVLGCALTASGLDGFKGALDNFMKDRSIHWPLVMMVKWASPCYTGNLPLNSSNEGQTRGVAAAFLLFLLASWRYLAGHCGKEDPRLDGPLTWLD